MISSIISRLVILLFGTLYPAYASYKAVKTKNVKEYVKWMMYWIVFALFTCAETFTDVFFSWFPFYYEIKVILVLWLLSPATRGSSILYRKFVHPMLSSREQEIDEYIARAREQSYKQVLDLGSKGVNVLMQTALKSGGGIVNQLRKSYSLSDLTDSSQSCTREEQTETDGLGDLNLSRKKRSHLTASTSSGLYFTEVDVRQDVVTTIKSTDDISSGYSSGEVLNNNQLSKLQSKEGLTRSGSITSTRSKSLRVTRSTIPKKTLAATDSDDDSEYQSQEEDVSDVGNKTNFPNKIDEKCNELKNEPPKTLNDNQNPPSNSNAAALIEGETKTLPEQQDALIKLNNASISMYKSKSVDSLNVLPPTEPSSTKPRAGKYKKKAAPLPPTLPETEKRNANTENVSTIRATLVLKPGSVVPIRPDDATSKEIVVRSPKLKNKKRSSTKTKEGSPFSRFLTLPKKFSFWHRDEEDNIEDDFSTIANLKRSSWYAELPKTAQLFLLNSRPISKSVENFHIESLTHSPKFRNKNENLDPRAD